MSALGSRLTDSTDDHNRTSACTVEQAATTELRRRTLTNLYNQRPTWLANLHAALDAAVFAAYGWPPDIGDDEMLERLLALNLERATAPAP